MLLLTKLLATISCTLSGIFVVSTIGTKYLNSEVANTQTSKKEEINNLIKQNLRKKKTLAQVKKTVEMYHHALVSTEQEIREDKDKIFAQETLLINLDSEIIQSMKAFKKTESKLFKDKKEQNNKQLEIKKIAAELKHYEAVSENIRKSLTWIETNMKKLAKEINAYSDWIKEVDKKIIANELIDQQTKTTETEEVVEEKTKIECAMSSIEGLRATKFLPEVEETIKDLKDVYKKEAKKCKEIGKRVTRIKATKVRKQKALYELTTNSSQKGKEYANKQNAVTNTVKKYKEENAKIITWVESIKENIFFLKYAKNAYKQEKSKENLLEADIKVISQKLMELGVKKFFDLLPV